MASRAFVLAAVLVVSAAAIPAVLAGSGATYEGWSHQLHDCQDDWGSDSSGTPEASGHDLVALDLREGIIPGTNGTGFGIRVTMEGGYEDEPGDRETLADVVNLTLEDADGGEGEDVDVVLGTRDNHGFVARSHTYPDHVTDRTNVTEDRFHVTAWYNHHRFGVDDGDSVLVDAVVGYHIDGDRDVHERDIMPGGYRDPETGERVEDCPTPADTQRYRNGDGYEVRQTPGPPPVANFTVETEDPEAGDEIRFADRSTDPNDTVEAREWRFGDGANATGPNPTHTYDEAGEYDVSLVVTDAEGNRNVTHRTLEVEPAGPVASAEVEPLHPHAGETVYLNATSGDSDENLTFDWRLGDGTTASGRNVTHVYAEEGTYEVTLNVTDAQGRSDEATGNLTVGPRQDATGDGDEDGAATGDDGGNATDGPDEEGDGTDGTWHQDDGSDEDEDGENRIPVARIDAPDRVPVGEPVTVDSRSHDPDGAVVAQEWDFGDGATHGNATANHTYEEAGVYTVTLTVVDDDGDRDQAVHRVTVGSPSDEGNRTDQEPATNETGPAEPTSPADRSAGTEDVSGVDEVPGAAVVGVVVALGVGARLPRRG